MFVYVYISKYHLLSQYGATCMYVFMNDYLALDNKLVCSLITMCVCVCVHASMYVYMRKYTYTNMNVYILLGLFLLVCIWFQG